MAKGQKGISLKSDKARRAGRIASREKTSTSTGSQAGVVAKTAKPVVLRSENAAKDKGTSHDALRASRVLIAAAYSVAGDVTNITPHFPAFGEGVPVDMSVGLSIDKNGKATVKCTCRVDGREFNLEG